MQLLFPRYAQKKRCTHQGASLCFDRFSKNIVRVWLCSPLPTRTSTYFIISIFHQCQSDFSPVYVNAQPAVFPKIEPLDLPGAVLSDLVARPIRLTSQLANPVIRCPHHVAYPCCQIVDSAAVALRDLGPRL